MYHSHTRRLTTLFLCTLPLMLLSVFTSFGQCGSPPMEPPQIPQIGGIYMPSGNGLNGTPTPAIIYAIVLFIEFPDDTKASNAWPKMTAPIGMMQDVIDLAPNNFSGKKYNITTYYRDMSAGKLVIIGQPVYKQARYTLAQYAEAIKQADAVAAGYPGDAGLLCTNRVRYWAIRHALEDLDKGDAFDFSPYDRWTINGAYNYSNAPDGQVDMIFACFRGHGEYLIDGDPTPKRDISFAGMDGAANMGGGNADFLMVNSAPNTKIIHFDEAGLSSSGVSILDMGDYPSRMMTVYHEFGHHLGLQHQYNGGVWALMSQQHRNVSSCANSYERTEMGWITPVTVSLDGEIGTLRDFATTYTAYRIPVEPNFNQYFLVENHQRLNSPFITRLPYMDGRPWGNISSDMYWNTPSYDIADQSPDGAPGLYILQQNGSLLSVVCADGRWSWNQAPCEYGPYQTVGAPWDQNQPLAVWDRGTINRTAGECDRQFSNVWRVCTSPPELRNADFMWAWRDPGTLEVINNLAKHRGDGHDRWHLGMGEYLNPTETAPTGTTVFTQWSNPSTRSLSGNTTVGMEVLSKNSTDYTAKFYLTGAANASPSIPQDLKVSRHWYTIPNSMTTSFWPELVWDPNTEPDVNPDGGYEIWRRNEPAGNMDEDWEYLGTVDGATTSFIDVSITELWEYGTSNPGDVVRYMARAVDESGNKSIFSGTRAIDNTGFFQKPVVNHQRDDAESRLFVHSSPNPSTGFTNISFTIPSEGLTTLTVFDALGEEVARLTDEVRYAGTHSIAFDATALPPGVYTYQVCHGGHVVGGKLLLLK